MDPNKTYSFFIRLCSLLIRWALAVVIVIIVSKLAPFVAGENYPHVSRARLIIVFWYLLAGCFVCFKLAFSPSWALWFDSKIYNISFLIKSR